MSVLIKGMEMPKNCHNCELLTRIGITYGTAYACQALNEVIGNVMVRQINCPLIEIPPHGDLIDRDEQIERAWRLNLSTRELIEEMLETAPTVIEAEENSDD